MSNSVHHVLFTKKCWSKGYAHKLRRMLAYNIPNDVHRNLHKAVPPVPPITEEQARELYVGYKKVSPLDIFDATEWLIENSPSEEFAIAMMGQSLYLRTFL